MTVNFDITVTAPPVIELPFELPPELTGEASEGGADGETDGGEAIE